MGHTIFLDLYAITQYHVFRVSQIICLVFMNSKKLRRCNMAGSTYKIIELVGTSDVSWEDAAKTAVEKAGESLKDLRIAEVTKLDMIVTNGKVTTFRTRLNVSFKYHK